MIVVIVKLARKLNSLIKSTGHFTEPKEKPGHPKGKQIQVSDSLGFDSQRNQDKDKSSIDTNNRRFNNNIQKTK